MEEEELEPGLERLARLLGAMTWSGAVGFFYGVFATDDLTFPPFLIMSATGAAFGLLFSLPQCAAASYFGRGFAGGVAFALFLAIGRDHDPVYEEMPAHTFIVTFYLGFLYLIGGLAGLVAISVVRRLRRTLNREH